MEYWQGPARWINTALVAVLALFGVHGLLLLIGAQETNPLVGLVARLARGLLTPVAGIVPGQGPLLTTVLGAVLAVVTALVVLAVLRGRQQRAAGQSGHGGSGEPGSSVRPVEAGAYGRAESRPAAERRTGT